MFGYLSESRRPSSSNTLSRRDFHRACALLVAGATAGCNTFVNSRATRHLISVPHPDDYRRVLDALVLTLLPFDHPSFPSLTAVQVVEKLDEYFPLVEPRFSAIRRAMMVFNDMRLFPTPIPPIIEAERDALTARGLHEDARERSLAEALAADSSRYESLVREEPMRRGTPFTALSSVARAKYLSLWARSGFTAKRRFYRTSKVIVFVAAYSFEALWETIGYGGPLIDRSP